MSALAALQRDFLHTLVGNERGLLAQLRQGEGVAPQRGLAVYVHAYSARLREALENDHAMLGRLLGDEAWLELATAYIDACPSRHASLRHFGDGLPAFLRRHARYAGTPLLAEFAAFERSLLDSFDAADARLAEWNDLLALPPTRWPVLRPAFVPALGRLVTRHGAVEAWKALRGGEAPPAATGARSDWAIWRDREQVTRFRSLPGAEAALLDHFLAGGDFGSACEMLTRWHAPDAVPAFALEQLQRWCEDGWVAGWRA